MMPWKTAVRIIKSAAKKEERRRTGERVYHLCARNCVFPCPRLPLLNHLRCVAHPGVRLFTVQRIFIFSLTYHKNKLYLIQNPLLPIKWQQIILYQSLAGLKDFYLSFVPACYCVTKPATNRCREQNLYLPIKRTNKRNCTRSPKYPGFPYPRCCSW